MAQTKPHNFYYGNHIPQNGLNSRRLKLVPFDPRKHAQEYFRQTESSHTLYEYLPFGPFSSADDFVKKLYEGRINIDNGSILFAVIDKTYPSRDHEIDRDGVLAGLIGFLNTNPTHLSTEIGFVIILPAFRRTHVASDAVAMLLHFALDGVEQGGLGLRRVAWKANELNNSSVGLARRMRFHHEGLIRWALAMTTENDRKGNGIQLRDGDPRPEAIGRHTWLGSVCWDDWIYGGVREHIDKLVADGARSSTRV